jgi:hypothetical protein
VSAQEAEDVSGYGGRDEDDACVEESDRERIADLKRIIGKQEQELVEADLRLREANARVEACLADAPGRWELAQKLEQAEAEVERLKFMNQHAVEWRYENENGEPNWTADESDIAELWTARAEADE